MTRLPRLTGREVIVALRKVGFEVVRVKGSHHFLRHPDSRATVVPVHSGETIGAGLLSRRFSVTVTSSGRTSLRFSDKPWLTVAARR